MDTSFYNRRQRVQVRLSEETLAALRELDAISTLADFREACWRQEERRRRVRYP